MTQELRFVKYKDETVNHQMDADRHLASLAARVVS
jgi:hypothetical protein